MKVVIAPDSFKGSISSIDLIQTIKGEMSKHFTELETIEIPIADGGEGTIEALVHASKGTTIPKPIKDPLLRTVNSYYGIIGQTAVIEMALCSGLTMMNPKERDPLLTTSYGTGEMIRHALKDGFKKIVVGIGGSGTNDGGTGAMQALGAKFYNKDNEIIPIMNGKRLIEISKIDTSDMERRLKNCEISVMCDVTNPLTGPKGATYVYGPQKGAGKEALEMLEAGMVHYESILETHFAKKVGHVPGAGAAGGIGAAFVGFLNAKLVSGIDEILRLADFSRKIEGADLIITGEGRVDGQSVNGKVIDGITKMATKAEVPVVVFAGGVGEGYEAVYDIGVKAVLPIVNRPMTLDEAMKETKQLVEQSVYTLCRLMQI